MFSAASLSTVIMAVAIYPIKETIITPAQIISSEKSRLSVSAL